MSRFEFEKELKESGYISKPLKVNYEEAANTRWKKKEVLASRLLDDMTNPENWSARGYGKISFPEDVNWNGHRVVRLTTPTKIKRTEPGGVYLYGGADIRRHFSGEDWSDYNRISFYVYPNLPGFKTVSLLVMLHNEGSKKVPDIYEREGKDFIILKNHEWNHVVCEIPHLTRDKVTAITFQYHLCGYEPGAAEEIYFDFAHLELQKVEADYYEGWDVAPGQIAFSHSGYLTGSRKTAIASGIAAKRFTVYESTTNRPVLTKEIQTVKCHTGEFQVMDFSEIREEGTYFIQAGEIITRTFEIGSHVWDSSIWKTINFFFCERCGMAIPGYHDACHRDCQVLHDDQSIIICGGWHDAGDLSQGLVNTGEAVYAMLKLAEKTADTNPILSERLLEEAKWGLDWVLRTRFKDGYRMVWGGMHSWSDGIIGTLDENLFKARLSPYETLIAIATEAAASRILADKDKILSDYCRKIALEDWSIILEKLNRDNTALMSQAVLAAAELYRITGDEDIINKAVEFSRVILNNQQTEAPDWEIPLTGFFYTDSSKTRIMHHEHRGHEQAPVIALIELCKVLPNHPMWMEWYAAVVLYSEYMKKITQYSRPYEMLPSSIYNINDKPQNNPYYEDQLRNGIKLSEEHYLRLFPAWGNLRGNCGTGLSQTKGLAAAAHLRQDAELMEICQRQLEWTVGRNPFNQSIMYGEGYNYAPQYSPSCGDMVGSLPVGIQTREEKDVPYWPAFNCYNYKEVWVHSSSRWLWVMEDLRGDARLTVLTDPADQVLLTLTEINYGQTFRGKADKSGKISFSLPQGQYKVNWGCGQTELTVLSGGVYTLDIRNNTTLDLNRIINEDGSVTIQALVKGSGNVSVELRAWNLTVENPVQEVELGEGQEQVIQWKCTVLEPNKNWMAVAIPNGCLYGKKEIIG